MIRAISSTIARPTDSTVFWWLIRAEAACRTESWPAQLSVFAKSSELWIAIEAWVATAVANSTSAGVQWRGRAVHVESAPMTRSPRTSGTTISAAYSRIPSYRASISCHSGGSRRSCRTSGRPVLRTVPNQPSSARNVGSRAATSSSIPAQAATSARPSTRIRIVVPSASRVRVISVTIVRKIASRSSVVVSFSAIPTTVWSRSPRSALLAVASVA